MFTSGYYYWWWFLILIIIIFFFGTNVGGFGGLNIER